MKRIEWLDIAKGIGIILMVVGHTPSPFNRFIYLFHMALFFIISGYLFKYDYLTSLKTVLLYIAQKIKSLWLPYFLWTSLFLILNNFFIHIGVYTVDKSILKLVNVSIKSIFSDAHLISNIVVALNFHAGTELGGALWFLHILFIANISYGVSSYILKQLFDNDATIVINGLIGFAFVLIAYNKIIIDGTFVKFSYAYLMLFVGQLLKYIDDNLGSIEKKYCLLAMSFISLILLKFSIRFGNISFTSLKFQSIWFFCTVSLLGWLFISSLAKVLKDIPVIKDILSIMGKQTISIMALHFLCFKLVNLIYLTIKNQPKILLACCPTIPNIGIWWMVYAFIGVVIPTVIGIGFDKFIVLAKEKILLSHRTK